MQYWASDVAGLIETLPPLFAFIKRLSDVGSISAKNMYGCQKGMSTPPIVSSFVYLSLFPSLLWLLLPIVTCVSYLMCLWSFSYPV